MTLVRARKAARTATLLLAGLIGATVAQTARPHARPPERRESAGEAEGSVRDRILRSIVGIKATLTTPKLSFKGKRRIEAQSKPAGGSGTGIVVREEGLILTCAHLIEDAAELQVYLADGRVLPASPLVSDRTSDLALLKVAAGRIAPLELANGKGLLQGQRVYLASRPGDGRARFEEAVLASTGTYHLGHNQLEFFRRFQGAIEPGDSGGALVDAEGRFLGLIAVGNPGGEMGYAVAREFVIVALARLGASRPVVWPWLGLGVETPRAGAGVLVWTVAPGSPAEAAGFRSGDRILTLDGRTVEHFLPAMLSILSKPVGTRFTLGVARATGTVPASDPAPAAPESKRATSGASDGAAAAGSRAEKDPDRRSGPGARTPDPGGAKAPAVEKVSLVSVTRPIEPVLPTLDLFERLTGITLAPMPAEQGEPAGLRVRAFTPEAEGSWPCTIGSRLVAVVPGAGLVRALEEGRTDQEIKVATIADLDAALRASYEGPRIAAVLIWATGGKLETMLLSGDAKQYPLL